MKAGQAYVRSPTMDMNRISSVPLIIDDSRGYHQFGLTRLTYFSIECDEPSPDWVLSIQNTDIPFHLLGLSGIILGPSAGKARFDSLEEIEQTFSIIEKDASLYIDINDLWLPNFLLYFAKRRGNVYRVTWKLFLMSIYFRKNEISKDDFIRSCFEMKKMIRYCLNESKVFRDWAKFQVKKAKGLYPKNQRHALKWVDPVFNRSTNGNDGSSID